MVYFEHVYEQSAKFYIYVVRLSIHSSTYPELKGTTQININPNLTSVAVAIFCFIARVCLFRNIIDQCLLENKYKLIVDFSLSSGKCWVDFDGTMCHAIRYWRCTFNYNRHTWNREMATILHMIQHATNKMCRAEHLGDFMFISV